MFPIPHAPVASNPYKRHYAETEPAASGKRTRAQTHPEPASDPQSLPDDWLFNLLSEVTTKRHVIPQNLGQWLTGAAGFDDVMECLTEADVLQFTVASVLHRVAVMKFYNSRMKPRLPFQPDPLPLRDPSDPSAQWTIVEVSLRSNMDRFVPGKLHRAKLRRHEPDQSSPYGTSIQPSRPLFGPKWKISHFGNRFSLFATYHAWLMRIGNEYNHPVYLYRDPRNRLDRYVPTDGRGLEYLSQLLIHPPLTKRIRNEPDMSVAKAVDFRAGKGQEICAAFEGGTLSENEKEMLKNPLFAEHVECGRIEMSAVWNLAQNEMNLFYCLSLLPLFRSGTLQLSDVSLMSAPAIRLLHDPRLVRLFCTGILDAEQLKSLTPTQYRSLAIFYQPLMQRYLNPQRVLDLQEEQTACLRKAGLLGDLSRGRIALSTAMLRAQRENQNPLIAESTPGDLPVKIRKRKFQPVSGLREACSFSSSSSSSSSSSWPSSSSSWSVSPFSSSSSRRPLVSMRKSDSPDRLSTLTSGAIRREPAQRPKAGTMALTNLLVLMRKWPVDALVCSFYDALESEDVQWIAAYQRVSQFLPNVQQIAMPDFEESSSSSSSSSPFTSIESILKSSLTGRSPSSFTGPVHQTTQPVEDVDVPLSEVALLLGQMPPKAVLAAIYSDGDAGNTDFVRQFGQIMHLMSLEKIIGFLNVKENGKDTFNSQLEGLYSDESKAVASAFNQIFIDLARHLNDTDYLRLATLFLDNEIGAMLGDAISQNCPKIISQCGEIWSLVQTKCEITGQPVKKYLDAALSSITSDFNSRNGEEGHCGTGREMSAAAFGSFLVTMRLEKDETFLKLWTNNLFNEEVDFDSTYQNLLGELGDDFGAIWHALFSACRQSDYGSMGALVLSHALGAEAAVDVDEASDVDEAGSP